MKWLISLIKKLVELVKSYEGTDLYPHVKQFFIEREFEVKAEVADCDVMAVRMMS